MMIDARKQAISPRDLLSSIGCISVSETSQRY